MFWNYKHFLIASIIGTVTAHQKFHQFWVNDITPGHETAIRMPPTNNPITDLQSKDLACNVNGSTIPSGIPTFPAHAGDRIKVQWDITDHPGPIQHFLLGPVGDPAMATGVGEWFKIDEFSQVDGKWAGEIMRTTNGTYEFVLPEGLVGGGYLLRSEMIALHGAKKRGGGQFYMGCAQLNITGSETISTSTCGPKITFPGAYREDDPSILIPDFYYGFDVRTYTAPGGAVATCGPRSASGTSPGSTLGTSVVVSTGAVTESSSGVVKGLASEVVSGKSGVSRTTLVTVSSPAPVTSSIAVSLENEEEEEEC
ncbi:hypothetical protein HYFRA_00005467 [Hymenoscyphus fraxineus]|uniref:AA9 family lytic polysaccharide monooxygenase n=1 Tax=Hymenoscyphus fraxineus TaxID=746836 RepID=A0A9N9PRP0_9HELO|nr:hypothetical protein HYFRA_00005467 [Hymenoscyphus fraxineus]